MRIETVLECILIVARADLAQACGMIATNSEFVALRTRRASVACDRLLAAIDGGGDPHDYGIHVTQMTNCRGKSQARFQVR
jgi:hypothetical protein